MLNDANCFALSEAFDGAAMDANIVFGIILGTGCGGVIDGKPLIGANAISGEWGHNPMLWMTEAEFPDLPCECGQTGCIKTFSSGTESLAHHYRETCEALTPKDIAARAASGDKSCDASMTRYEIRLASALASIINMIDPDVIVLGDGVSKSSLCIKMCHGVPRNGPFPIMSPPRWLRPNMATQVVFAVPYAFAQKTSKRI
jgi:fructokinase